MAEIETRRDDIKALTGVHLFHFAMSNCSQRVRLVLEEKAVRWTSHHVSLPDNEHVTPEFQALNPNGVVPVLIHDGRTIVESNDIIDYVDHTFDGPTLCPENEADADYLTSSLAASSSLQGTIKLLSHEFLFKPVRRMSEQQLDDLEKNRADEKLVAFMREFSSRQGFGDTKIRAAVHEVDAIFAALDNRLESNPWLSGQAYGLADISWVVNVHRVAAMRYPIARHPHLAGWLTRMYARPAFQKAVTGYEPAAVKIVFAAYSIMRRLNRSGIAHYLKAA
ncbi:glutathione S-transferase family protein [Pyruvatibacter sp.]|uniref:glutathione S-transferase family protein n=1 Tax=Pyruvatibacter sp. TaxID=1981328 RepID=UPI0032ED3594